MRPAVYLVLVLVLVAGLLSGCAEMPMRPAEEGMASTESGYGRAFGRLLLVEDGKEKTFGIFAGTVGNLYVRSVQTERVQVLEMKDDGSFIWPLQAGDYVVAAFSTLGPPRSFRIWASFSVPQAGQGIYIGTLRLELRDRRFQYSVEDHFDAAVEKIRPLLAAQKLELRKGLMQPEAPLGNVKRVIGACEAPWGVVCEARLFGLQPVEPSGTAQEYAQVPSLTPRLSWKPSPKQSVHYDVAVYESLPLALDVPGALRSRGSLIAYGEDLRDPLFQIPAPLRPGRKYDWSVRMRDGETVSSWSTTSYFVFFLFGWASGSGQWFGFRTPVQ